MSHGKCKELNKLRPVIEFLYINKYPNRAERRKDASINKTPVATGLNVPSHGQLKFIQYKKGGMYNFSKRKM